MIQLDLGYRTGSGNLMSMTVIGQMIDRNDVTIVSREDAKTLCGDCKGFNGGCPSYAPSFDKIKPSMPMFYVVNVFMDMRWSLLYAGGKLNQDVSTSGARIRLNMYRIVYIDRLTDNYTTRVVRQLAPKTDSYPLGLGNCNGCPVCSVLETGKCSKPDKRMYSMEATGVECSALNEILYGSRLPWWYRTETLPIYMARYAGVFVAHGWSESMLDHDLQDICEHDKTYVDADDVSHLMPDCDSVIDTAPDGAYDEGVEQTMWEVF